MKKNAQIAMEFLMTYGWAIIVVLGAISALAYFGAINPKNLLPDRTVFSAPISNVDNAVLDVTGHTINIAYQNNKGVNIIIPRNTTINSPNCPSPAIINVTEVNGSEIPANQQIQNGERFIIKWQCGPVSGLKAGDRISADVVFDYKNTETGQMIKQSGTVEGKWT